MLVVFLRTLILYALVVLGMRIMGKRQLGELQPSELVTTILISNIATLPIENTNVPLLSGAVPILTLMCFEVILSYLGMKNRRFRTILSGTPRIIIRQGKMIQELSAKEMEARARVFVSFKTKDMAKTLSLLQKKYKNVKQEQDYIRVYDEEDVDGIVKYLIDNNLVPSEIHKNKVGLEEYYIELMSQKEEK